jgi:hypothetical protein
MTFDEFKRSLAASEPPAGTSLALASLWWMAKGDWTRAHDLVNDAEGRDEAWVHAHLHRVEGDLANAGYWYRQAKRAPSSVLLETERDEIARALLEGGRSA